MSALAEFQATVFKITTDGRDGDSRIILDVSRAYLSDALRLNLAIGKLLDVTLSLSENQIIGGVTSEAIRESRESQDAT